MGYGAMHIAWRLRLLATHIAVWIMRFRHRKGYGVHSPFAFNFITQVIYKPLPADVKQQLNKRQTPETDNAKLPYARIETGKVRRLLYNVIYKTQADTIVMAGNSTVRTLSHIKQARPTITIADVNEKTDGHGMTGKTIPPQLVYINAADNTPFVRRVFSAIADDATAQTVFVANGLYRTKDMRQLWKDIVNDKRSGITFDLYEAGIVLFDKKITKQDYIVNY